MKITILTLFPEIIEHYCNYSIMKRALDNHLLEIKTVNIRDFALDTHNTCDDIPYGGGYGMVLKPEPLANALDSVGSPAMHTIFPTPCAPLYTQQDAQRLSTLDNLVFICGRYEGIDERIIDMYVTEVFSLGEYVISSGELATLTIVDSIYRLLKGVIREESYLNESYTNNMLEYPQYTRPAEFRGHTVPEVLLSGNHKAIAEWRALQSEIRTKKYKR